MDICTFKDHYFNPLSDKLSKEPNKTIVLLGDFNINFLNFDTSNHINTSLEDLAFNSLQPQFLLATRVCKNSKTLLGDTFCNIPNPLVKSAISVNITFSILDHFPQFFILPDFFSNSTPTKYNMSHDCSTSIISYFLQFEKINWNQVLQLNQNNVNLTFDNYLNTMNALINSHAPLKNSTKNKESFNKKRGLQEVSKVQLMRKIDSFFHD